MFDYAIYEVARTRYNDMLHEAELERRAHQVRRAQRQERATPFFVLIGDWLIESGSWLKQHNQMRPGLR